MKSPTDESLMAAYRGGDIRAFEAIYDRYAKRLLGYFLYHFGDRWKAEDLMQETMLRLHRARDGYDPSRALAGWIFGIAANIRKDELRRRGRRPGDEAATTGAIPEGLVAAFDGIAAAERRVDAEAAVAAVRRLPTPDREIVLMHTVGGVPLADVAVATGLSLSAVKARAVRAYRKVARLMEGEGRP